MFRSLNIRKRLSVVYGLFALVIIVIGGFGAYSMKSVESRFQQYAFHVVEAAQHAGLIRTGMATLRRYEKDMVISVADPAKVKEYADLWEATYKAVEKDFGELERRLRDDKVKQMVATARSGIKSYHDNIAATLPKLEGVDVATANTLMRAGRDGYVQADKIFEETLSLVQGFTQKVKQEFADALGTVLMVTGALALISIGLMLVLGRAISGSIVEPLRKAQGFAEQVREGDLTGELQAMGQDETAQLSRSLSEMQGSLQTIVGQVRQAADSISTASSEVASGNQDLSHRTEQTAASLQQTASAMNQLTATVNQTADAARTASQLASQASTSAERGGAVVAEVVSTMERINQSSRRIADIIGTIDGIAFQTNILALNAAVEAARAGEQGRGFAVVAGEVRSLAQRSAEAAKEIKSLIGASVESVDNGTRLVADAGSTMTEIVGNVQRVTDIIGEISAAAGEQSAGIGNVNQSVAQLDQATQQNAALVEESAAAAQSLRDQAQKLSEVVATFRLPSHAALRNTPAPKAASPSPAPRPAPSVAAKSAAPALKKPVSAAPKAAAPAASPRPAAPPPAAASDDDWETF